MRYRNIQTYIRKYDTLFTAMIARIPSSLQPLSSKLGKITLPSIWAALLIVICLIAGVYGYRQLALFGVIVIACIPVGSILKLFIRRSRPKTIYAQNMRVKSYSFPSSHTYAATIAGGYLTLFCLTSFPMPFNILGSVALTALIITIGISRIHVGAHYPTDVTAGWILGVAVLYTVMQINIQP